MSRALLDLKYMRVRHAAQQWDLSYGALHMADNPAFFFGLSSCGCRRRCRLCLVAETSGRCVEATEALLLSRERCVHHVLKSIARPQDLWVGWIE